MYIPQEVLNSWPAPNHVDPVTRGLANVVVNLVLFPLLVILVALRVFTRLRISKSFGLDDWLIVAAVIPTTAFAVISMIIERKWDRHIWDVDRATITLGLKLCMTSQILFDCGASLTKLSMLALTYRIIGTCKRLRQFIVLIAIVIALDWGIFIILVMFQCRPTHLFWTISTTPQKCIPEEQYLLTAGVMNTFADFLVVMLPIPTLWKLQLHRREQVILMVLFGIGFIICAAGCVRTYYMYLYTIAYDRTWAVFPVWITTDIELYLAIICASVPATKKFFTHYFGILKQTISPSSHGSQSLGSRRLSQIKLHSAKSCEASANSTSSPYDKDSKELDKKDIRVTTTTWVFDFQEGAQEEQDTVAPLERRHSSWNEMHNMSRTDSQDGLVSSAKRLQQSHIAIG